MNPAYADSTYEFGFRILDKIPLMINGLFLGNHRGLSTGGVGNQRLFFSLSAGFLQQTISQGIPITYFSRMPMNLHFQHL